MHRRLLFLPMTLVVVWLNKLTFFPSSPSSSPSSPSPHHQLFVSLGYRKHSGGHMSFAVMQSCFDCINFYYRNSY